MTALDTSGGAGFGLPVTVAAARPGDPRVDAEWTELLLAGDPPSCFATPAYFRAWFATEGKGADVLLLLARRGSRLVGLMPLMRVDVRRGPSCAPRHDFTPADRDLMRRGGLRPFRVRQLSPAASIPAIYLGPAPQCAPEDRAEIIRAMAGALAGLGGWDSFVVPVAPGDTQALWLEALRAAGYGAWVMDLGRTISGIAEPKPFAQMIAAGNRNFRKNIRRAEAAAQTAGLRFFIHEGAAVVAAHLPQIAEVATQSWKAQGRETTEIDIPFAGRQEAFLASLLSQPDVDATARPVLAIAQTGDRPVAVLLCLRTGTGLTALLTFRTPDAAEASPGLLLIGRMLDWAAERGLHRFDLNMTQNWARHLTNTSHDQNYVVSYASSWRGRRLAAISSLARRLRR